jgi:serine/threonine protein phosphatase 1
MKKTFVVGDIHGGLKALQQLLDGITITKNDTLIFLGDYVDGWSDSANTVDFLINLKKEFSCIFIKGNHDVWCEDWLRTGKADSTWVFHGGQSTINSYENWSAEKRLAHLQFFESMKFYFVDEQNRLFIHAGFTSMHGPEKEFYKTNYNWDRTLWEMALTMDNRIQKDSKIYPKRLLLFKEIFIGHTPTLYYDVEIPMQACNVWNIDTGAAFKGKLSILNVNTKEFWQSEIVQHFYPNELGRNKD